MASNDFTGESPENYTQKTICCFVLDTSGSMSGQPINALNSALQQFYRDISNDSDMAEQLEVAIVTFDSHAKKLRDPALVANFTMPVLSVSGTTALVDGVRKGIELVEDRKEWYKNTGQSYMRPWIILITDGAPDSNQDVQGLSHEIEEKTKARNFMFFQLA